MKKKSKLTKALIAATFLIGIIAIVTPVSAANSNRVFFMAIGDDLDIARANNIIIGKIKLGDEPPSASVFFYSKIYDDSGEKYTMMGMLKDGYLFDNNYSFFCPLFKVWFIEVWLVQGMGKFRATGANIEVYFRALTWLTMPNTEGKFVSAPIVMALSHSGEYCMKNPTIYTPGSQENPIYTDRSPWVLAGPVLYVPEIKDYLPIAPLSSLTISIGI